MEKHTAKPLQALRYALELRERRVSQCLLHPVNPCFRIAGVADESGEGFTGGTVGEGFTEGIHKRLSFGRRDIPRSMNVV
jgi:hypothetical protein